MPEGPVIIPPWAYAAGGITIAAIGFGTGWQVRAWKCDSAIAKIERELEAEAAKQRARADAAANGYEIARAQIDTQSHDVRTIIEREFRNVEVPADCAVPEPVADSLRQAVEGANRAATGQPSPTVP